MTGSQLDLPGRIVVVDDDPTVADVVERYLVRDGHSVQSVRDGYEALRLIAARPPDLVVLDLMLPGIDGLEVCKRLRERWPIPVVMLTALGEESDRLAGFEIGADDYVTKPFSPRELAMRVRSVLRRARSSGLPDKPDQGVIANQGLSVDLAAHEVRINGKLIQLTSREYDLLLFLMRNPRSATPRRSPCTCGGCGRSWNPIRRCPGGSSPSGASATATSRSRHDRGHGGRAGRNRIHRAAPG